MASPNAARAVPAAAGDDPRKHDLAGELIGSLYRLRNRQAQHLQRRFKLPAPVALAVASLAYAEARE